jgi:hypothetical protein
MQTGLTCFFVPASFYQLSMGQVTPATCGAVTGPLISTTSTSFFSSYCLLGPLFCQVRHKCISLIKNAKYSLLKNTTMKNLTHKAVLWIRIH